MSIRHAILGLLAEQPMHGYRLKAVFAERMSPLWGLSTGQIYQCLGALEHAGFVESRGERVGNRPARRVYSVTERGRRELSGWLQDGCSVWVRPFREDLLIRLMLLREHEAETLLASLARQEHEIAVLLARVVHAKAARPRRGPTVDVRTAFLEGMTHHLEADLKLLRSCREETVRWARSPAAGRSPR